MGSIRSRGKTCGGVCGASLPLPGAQQPPDPSRGSAQGAALCRPHGCGRRGHTDTCRQVPQLRHHRGTARHPQPVPHSCVSGPSTGLLGRRGTGGTAPRRELLLSSPAGVWAPLEMMKASGERREAGCWYRLTRSSPRSAAPFWEPSRPAESQLLLQVLPAGQHSSAP